MFQFYPQFNCFCVCDEIMTQQMSDSKCHSVHEILIFFRQGKLYSVCIAGVIEFRGKKKSFSPVESGAAGGSGDLEPKSGGWSFQNTWSVYGG